MDVSEIVDQDSLKAWLNSLPQGTEAEKAEVRQWALLITHRAAMRALPWHWALSRKPLARERNMTALPFLWLNILGEVIAKERSPAIRAAASEACARVDRYELEKVWDIDPSDEPDGLKLTIHTAFISNGTAAAAAGAAHYAAQIAGVSAGSAAKYVLKPGTDFQTSVDTFRKADKAGVAAAWAEFRSDCLALQSGQDPLRRPLWDDDDNVLGILWNNTRKGILAEGADWRFWVERYDKALKGAEQDLELLTRIALIDADEWTKIKISEDTGTVRGDVDWISCADYVNGEIAGIEREHAQQLGWNPRRFSVRKLLKGLSR